MDGHDSPQIGNNDIDYKPTKLLSAFLKGRVQQSVKVTFFLILVIVLVRMKGE